MVIFSLFVSQFTLLVCEEPYVTGIGIDTVWCLVFGGVVVVAAAPPPHYHHADTMWACNLGCGHPGRSGHIQASLGPPAGPLHTRT